MNAPSDTPLDLGMRVRQSPRIATRTLDGQALVVQLDRQRLHTLNGVGTRVFELADGRTLEAIVSVVLEEFDVDPEVARADLVRFVHELIAIGAIERLP